MYVSFKLKMIPALVSYQSQSAALKVLQQQWNQQLAVIMHMCGKSSQLP